MKEVISNTAVNVLRQLSINWKANFIEYSDAAKITFDNEIGKGSVYAYDISESLTARVYDVVFHEDIEFEIDKTEKDFIYFFFSVEGHFYHKFKSSGDFEKITKLTNFFIRNNGKDKNTIVFPKGIALKFSAISVNTLLTSRIPTGTSTFLQNTLAEITNVMQDNKSLKHFGTINLDAANHVRVLVKNGRTDAVGRLLIQASILNILSMQLRAYEKEVEISNNTHKFRQEELNAIIQLNVHISKNISEKLTVKMLASKAGLNINKLQKGFKYVYGETVNNFVKKAKLEYAKELMQTSDMSVSEISYAVGLTSKSYFTKIFKEHYSILPSEYNRQFIAEGTVFELSYKSDIVSNFKTSDLQDILKVSRKHNSKKGITGCLVFFEGHFFQFLEGSKSDILALYQKIEKDGRHKNVELIWKGPKASRIFSNWDLALVTDEGHFEVEANGKSTLVNLKEIMDSAGQTSLSNKLTWNKVRNLIRVA